MEAVSFVVIYILVVGILLFVLLFGESPIFQNTAVQTCHYGLTTGICIVME